MEGEGGGCCSNDGDDGDGDGGGGDYVFFIGAARRSGPHDRLQPSPRRLCQRARASTPHGRARSVAEQRRTVRSPVQQLIMSCDNLFGAATRAAAAARARDATT